LSTVVERLWHFCPLHPSEPDHPRVILWSPADVVTKNFSILLWKRNRGGLHHPEGQDWALT
jgi:hypothetical protein